MNKSTHTSPAWIITGPTSGIGRRTALELAKHGTVVLVGRFAQASDRRTGEQCGHYADKERSECARVGPRFRDKSSWTVHINRGAYPSSGRRCEHRVHLLRR
ncbi:hypothetical protein [Paenibacillus sp. SI8]|uniref:hypothetical protein n=1 Tax=unclassified Paenibacillus TaxID=185978 RepID=UPI0034657F11